MYSSEDLYRFYFQYQTEALLYGESIQSFCVKNKVLYNIFSKWYKDTRKQIVEEKVDGRPSDSEKEKCLQSGVCPKLNAYKTKQSSLFRNCLIPHA